MNSVQLVGRLATDVDLKEVTGGSKVCSFILAVDRSAEEAELRVLRPLGEKSVLPAVILAGGLGGAKMRWRF